MVTPEQLRRAARTVALVLNAEDLLGGPRGRGLCVAVAGSLRPGLDTVLFYDDLREVVTRLLTELEGLDATPISGWQDPLEFVEPLGQSIGNAMCWQEPFAADIAAADPAVTAALRPVADAITRAPASRWWDSPVDPGALRYSIPYEDGPLIPPPLVGAQDSLRQWRAWAARDEQRVVGGNWWSTPAGASLTTTTRPLPTLGATHLVWQEDAGDAPRAAIWSLTPTSTPRVWEIDCPDSWTRLVERYPFDVSHSRRHDWYATTGRTGSWAMPDWAAVAADWDAVHLSVAGYLATATRSLELPDSSYATVLAGWDPDETWWINDVLALDQPDPERWKLTPSIEDARDPFWQRVIS